MPSSRGFDLWALFSLERIGQFKNRALLRHKEFNSKNSKIEHYYAIKNSFKNRALLRHKELAWSIQKSSITTP